MNDVTHAANSDAAIREDVCEHCAFSNFGLTAPVGDCRANPPMAVIVPQQVRDLATGRDVLQPSVQSVFPPVERRTFCYAFESREGEHVPA